MTATTSPKCLLQTNHHTPLSHTPVTPSRISRIDLYTTRKARRASRAGAGYYPESLLSHRHLWEQRASDSGTDDDDEDEDEDDYSWYYENPERYIFRPRKTRRSPPTTSLKNTPQWTLSYLSPSPDPFLVLNEDTDNEDARSCSSYNLSGSESISSGASSIMCSTPSTPQGPFSDLVEQGREAKWSLVDVDTAERRSLRSQDWVKQWMLSSLRVRYS